MLKSSKSKFTSYVAKLGFLEKYFKIRDRNNFNVFLETLPEPIEKYQKNDIYFSVYKAKDYFEDKWVDEKLKKIVLKLRGTFLRYGDVPLLDQYDKKSSIYLVKAHNIMETADEREIVCDEWLSVRFVPAEGEPSLSEDLDVCKINNLPFVTALKQPTFKNKKSYEVEDIVTISRLCGMKNVNFDNKNIDNFVMPNKLHYTQYSFAVLCNTFLHDIEKNKLPFKLVTCLMRPDFVKKFMILNNEDNNVIKFPLKLAENFLGLSKNSVTIDRNILSYKYPGYFFRSAQLLKFLHKIIRDKKISITSLKRYLGKDFDIEILNKMFYKSKLEFLNKIFGLGDLFSVKGKIPGSTITGEELRDMLDKEVGDAPNMYLMDVRLWNENIRNLMKDLGIIKL